MASVKSYFTSYSTQTFPWFWVRPGSASNFPEFNCQLLTLQTTEGEKIKSPPRHRSSPPHLCNFRERKELSTNISRLCLGFPFRFRTLWYKALLQIPLCNKSEPRSLKQMNKPYSAVCYPHLVVNQDCSCHWLVKHIPPSQTYMLISGISASN